MKILVTGAAGFVGRNLCCRLENIRDGKQKAPAGVIIEEVMKVDIDTPPEELADYCRRADFVFNLAGVNRPRNPEEFRLGNAGFAGLLLEELRRSGNNAPVMLSSSIQASLEGRYAGSPYGESKLEGEELFFEHGRLTGAPVLVYRFPNLFGKWGRPNYNSVIATFCHNIGRGLPLRVDNPETELEFLYIDDLVDVMVDALGGNVRREGKYCVAGPTHRVTLGEIVALLESFDAQSRTLEMPPAEPGSFASKLHSTYLSYLPADKAIFDLKPHSDHRGSFTEFMRLGASGQMSVNVSEPGITKGDHWHDSKWEQFLVVSGHGLIRLRPVGDEKVTEFEVSGDRPQVVRMLPGYTHSIVNLSDSERMVTLMWANEAFDPERPDTFRDPV